MDLQEVLLTSIKPQEGSAQEGRLATGAINLREGTLTLVIHTAQEKLLELIPSQYLSCSLLPGYARGSQATGLTACLNT